MPASREPSAEASHGVCGVASCSSTAGSRRRSAGGVGRRRTHAQKISFPRYQFRPISRS
ncbi:UNVERIFIED_CONTAM: hypothetical protein GTU68_030230 [Idotea baltica]|nr:hypothetical protein [Idotea baltica]